MQLPPARAACVSRSDKSPCAGVHKNKRAERAASHPALFMHKHKVMCHLATREQIGEQSAISAFDMISVNFFQI